MLETDEKGNIYLGDMWLVDGAETPQGNIDFEKLTPEQQAYCREHIDAPDIFIGGKRVVNFWERNKRRGRVNTQRREKEKRDRYRAERKARYERMKNDAE